MDVSQEPQLQLRRVTSASIGPRRISTAFAPDPVLQPTVRDTNEPSAGTANDSSSDTTKYPEGGLKAWSVVFGAWCAMFSSMGLLNTLAVLHAWIATNELAEMSEVASGWIFSTYAFFLYFCGVQTGPLFDAYDVKMVVVPGCIGIVASLVFLSLSTEFYQFLLSFGVLGGSSASLLFQPSVAAIGHWFHERRALATGIACTAGGTGGVIFPLILVYLAPRIGFAWSMRVIALICAVLGVMACFLLDKRVPVSRGHARGAAIDLRSLLDVKFGVTTLATFLIEFAVFIPYTYLSSYGMRYGLTPQKAYLLNAYLNAGAIPGRVLPGYLADQFGAFNIMCVTALVNTVLIFALWLLAGVNETMVVSFAVLFGFWSGAAISLTPICISRVCKIEDYGKRMGTAFFVASFGALLGIPIAGAILQQSRQSYNGLVVFAGSLYAGAFLAYVAARRIAGDCAFRNGYRIKLNLGGSFEIVLRNC